MTVIRLSETGPGVTVSLTAERVRRLAASGVVDVLPGQAAGQWVIRGRNKVGVARIGDVELHIDAKVPVKRLLFLLGYARDPRAWRDEPVQFEHQPDLVPALAGALWRQTERALAHGVLHGYRATDDSSSVLRGRLRETDQLGRHLGSPLPLEIRHDDFTMDIPENRILATAARRMLRVPGIDAESARMLRHHLGRLTGVTQLRPGERPPAWSPSRLNARYHAALRLAELVLATTSVEVGVGGIVSNGLLLDMPALFEDFLTAALRGAIERRHGGRVGRQEPTHLDRAQRHRMMTDITWSVGGRVGAVVDAKYKTHTPSDDLYQMLAYCTALRLPRGHLVYAGGAHVPGHYLVRHVDIEIVCHVLDLNQPPAELLASVGTLADQIAVTPTTLTA